ncbi:hypothetical protein LBMAG53_24170 [Planctomycetota bacterium]|nr:hypothetical protein LBMAG53_24170 [Planctomycetota bacterium]
MGPFLSTGIIRAALRCHTAQPVGPARRSIYPGQSPGKSGLGERVQQALVLILILLSGGVLAQDPAQPLRLGVIGDSLSTGYAGIAWSSTDPRPRNWVELLASSGRADPGPWQDRPEGRQRPGFAFVWAASGAGTAEILAAGWVEAAAQALAAGRIEAVAVFIGHDDFRALLTARSIGQVVSDGVVDSLLADLDGRFSQILNRLGEARRGRILVHTLAEWQRTPFIRSLGLNPDEYRRLANAVARANGIIRAAARRRGLAVVDIERLTHSVLGGATLRVGGLVVETGYSADASRCCFIADGMHPGTLVSALIANQVIPVLNAECGTAIPIFSPAESLAAAGLADLSPPPEGGP